MIVLDAVSHNATQRTVACQQLGALCWGPVRNATGFALFEFSLGTKWLELLKELAPGIERAAVLRMPRYPPGRPM
jgi:hypothetical protein